MVPAEQALFLFGGERCPTVHVFWGGKRKSKTSVVSFSYKLKNINQKAKTFY